MNKQVITALLATLFCTAPLFAVDRGLGNPKSVFIPKGTVAVSLTGGYNSWKASGEELTKGAALGFPTMSPEYEFVAVPGQGKAALRLQTQGIEALKKLAAGSLFTGKLSKIDIFSQTAELLWGTPFTTRPAALEGYVCSQPKTIDYAEGIHADKKGQLDKASVTVILSDWEEPFTVSPPTTLVDVENDPHIIGYGKMTFEKEMTAYEKFHLDITYRNDRTPTMVTVVTSSSYLGDYFTGGSGSVVYFDEFQFIYY